MSFPGWRELLAGLSDAARCGRRARFRRSRAVKARRRARRARFRRAGRDHQVSPTAPTPSLEQISGSLCARPRGRSLDAARPAPACASPRDAAIPIVGVRCELARKRCGYAGVARRGELPARRGACFPLVGLMPQKDVRDRLRDLAPTGEWTDMRLNLARASVSDPWHFDARAKFRGMGFAPGRPRPGSARPERHARRQRSGGARGHRHPNRGVQLARSVSPADRTAGAQDDPLLEAKRAGVAGGDLGSRAAHARGARAREARLAAAGDGSSPIFTLASTIDNGNAADAPLYFPQQLFRPPRCSGSIARSSRATSRMAMRFSRDRCGAFRFATAADCSWIRFNVDHLMLDYREGWPRIENLAAQAEFRNQGMTVKVTSALAGALKVDSADARFVDFKNGELEIHAAAHGDAADALGYLPRRRSMRWRSTASRASRPRAPCAAAWICSCRSRNSTRGACSCTSHLDGATLNRHGSSLAATESRGDADIDGAQVVRADMRGRVLGGPFQMTARAPRNRPAPRTQLDFRGTLDGDALRTALASARGRRDRRSDGLARRAAHGARARARALAAHHSNLAGTRAQPSRAAAQSRGRIAAGDGRHPMAGAERTQLRVALGSVLRGDVTSIRRSERPQARARRRLVRRRRAARSAMPQASTSAAASTSSISRAGSSSAPAPSRRSRFRRICARRSSSWAGSTISACPFSTSRSDSPERWRLAHRARRTERRAAISLPGPGDPSEPWDLEFERLKFVDAARRAGAGDGRRDRGERRARADPRSIPAIRFHAAELTWGDRQFGDVRATLVKLDDGISLKQLTATSATTVRTPRASGAARTARHIEGTITQHRRGGDLEATRFRRRDRGEDRAFGFRSELAGRADGRGSVRGRGPCAGGARQGPNRRFEAGRRAGCSGLRASPSCRGGWRSISAI